MKFLINKMSYIYPDIGWNLKNSSSRIRRGRVEIGYKLV